MAEAARLTDTVRDLLESGRRERLSQVLEDAHAADIAAALRDLTLPDQVTLFRLLGRESAGAVLAELDDQPLHELARALDEGEISGTAKKPGARFLPPVSLPPHDPPPGPRAREGGGRSRVANPPSPL